MPPPRGRGASPFGDPFTFGKALVLNSQPPAAIFASASAPRADASASSDDPTGGGAVTRSRVSSRARRKVGGYGVTAPSKRGPKDTFTRTTGTDARESQIPGDERDVPARAVPPRVVTKIPVLDEWDPSETENADPSTSPPHVDDVPASAAATKAARGRDPVRTTAAVRGAAPRRPRPAPSTQRTKRPATSKLHREEHERGRNDAAAVVIAARARAKASQAPPRVAFGGRPPKKPSPVKRQRGSESGIHPEEHPEEVDEDDSMKPKPGFSFGVRPHRTGPSSWGPGADSPGPAAYHDGPVRGECDQVKGHVPAVTFGAPPDKNGIRRSVAGGFAAGAFPPGDPDAPGPGEYARDDVNKVLDKIGGKSRAPAFTFGGGKDDIGLKSEKDLLGGPGPGAYHIDEILAVAAERKRIEKGFSFGERVGAAWHEAGPGKDAPAPGTYDEDVRRSGTHGGFSFGNDLRFAPSSKDKDGPTPGPGDYLDKDNKKDGNDKENKMRKSVEGLSGFTFGWRRPESAKKSAEPGPGAYHRDAIVDDPDALRPGPAFSLGTKLTTNVSGVNKDASKMPGPGDYEVQPRGSSDHAGPSYTIPGRPNDGVVAGVDLKDKASMPGPGRYHTPLSPGGRAYTLGPRIETKDGKKDFPAPGEYGAPMQPGSKFGDGKRGFSVLGRDAWVGSGWGEEHAEVPGVGRYEVRGSNSNPLPSAPAFTMASKTKNQDQASNDIGPGEYDGDGSKPPSGPSFTIGVRGSKDGAYGDLEKAAEKPGPGAYPNAAKAKDETRESAPSFSLGVKTTVVDDRTRVGPGGYSDLPGPGEYHGEHHELAHPDGPGGFTIYERTKSLEFKPGMESPGPAHYGGFTTDDVEPGLQMSIHPRFESGGAFEHTDRSDTPGPGEYTPEVFQFPVRADGGDGSGESLAFVGAPVGYTIGVRRSADYPVRKSQIGRPGPGEYAPENDGVTDPAWSKGVTIGTRHATNRRSAESRPGPGYYHRTRESIERETGRKAPIRGAKIQSRKPWEREKVREKKADVPGPADYDTERGVRRMMDKRSPAYRIGERRRGEDRDVDAPGPGEYAGDVTTKPDPRRGASIIADRRDRTRKSQEGRPGPGEYHKDTARDGRSAVNIGKGAGKDAPGGVFDAAFRSGPGPGEFEPGPGALRKKSTGVNIRLGTTKDAPGGVFDGAKADGPGPGEHWPEEGTGSRAKRFAGFKIPATGHDAPGGASVWPEDAPGPGEYQTERKPNARSAVNIGKASGKDAPGGVFDAALKSGGPGPGEFEPGPGAIRKASTAVNIARGTGRDAPGGAMDRRDGPGPGEFWPDADGGSGPTGRPKGIPFGKPPKPPKRSSAPGPGEYAGSVVGTRDVRLGPTIPKGKRRGLVDKDAGNTPAPGDFEPEHHPKTVAGLVREALRQPGHMREPSSSRKKSTEDEGFTPGPGAYYSGRGEIRVDRGVKMPTREAWEKDRDRVKGSGLGPKYHPKYEKAAKPLSVKRFTARTDDYADSFRSTRGGSRR